MKIILCRSTNSNIVNPLLEKFFEAKRLIDLKSEKIIQNDIKIDFNQIAKDKEAKN